MATPISAPQSVASGSCGCGCASSDAGTATNGADARGTGVLSGAASVRDVLTAFPAAMPVFHAHGIDTCCGAGASLRDAAATAGTDLDALLVALEVPLGPTGTEAGQR